MDQKDYEVVFESDKDDCESFIWGRPIYDIEQNEENYARYGGPMPWPPFPTEDLENQGGWDITGLHFDYKRLCEERIKGFMLFRIEDAAHVRQFWAIENWIKWCEECEAKGINPYRHYDEIFFGKFDENGHAITNDETNKAYNKALEEPIIKSKVYL